MNDSFTSYLFIPPCTTPDTSVSLLQYKMDSRGDDSIICGMQMMEVMLQWKIGHHIIILRFQENIFLSNEVLSITAHAIMLYDKSCKKVQLFNHPLKAGKKGVHIVSLAKQIVPQYRKMQPCPLYLIYMIVTYVKSMLNVKLFHLNVYFNKYV